MEKFNMGISKDSVLVVWGCGYIGFSDIVFFGQSGRKCIGIDVDPRIKEYVSQGKYKKDLDAWLDIDYSHLITNGTIDVTNDASSIIDKNVAAYFLCVPTEKNGLPEMSVLSDVVEQIVDLEKERNSTVVPVLIESTMVPGTAKKLRAILKEKLPDKSVYFGVAPRRDWFLGKDKNLVNLPRVLGADSQEALEYFYSLLSEVCRNIVVASGYEQSEMCKSVENAFRHMDIILANQLADAFPSIDIREVLQLAGTKWNINTYIPSFGTGGYCIPLSSKYLLEGAMNLSGNTIPILSETVYSDTQRPLNIGEKILAGMEKGTVGVFGISYKADTSVIKCSPALSIVNKLRERGFEVFITDSEIDKSIIENVTGCTVFNCADRKCLAEFDAVVLCTWHTAFGDPLSELLPYLKESCIIYDGTEAPFNGWPEERYRRIGTPSWFLE